MAVYSRVLPMNPLYHMVQHIFFLQPEIDDDEHSNATSIIGLESGSVCQMLDLDSQLESWNSRL